MARKKAVVELVENEENSEVEVDGENESGGELATVGATEVAGEEQYADIRQKVKDLRRLAEDGYWQLSEVMFEVYTESFYVAWGFKTWKEYVESELDFQPRKAQYLVEIQGYFHKCSQAVQDWVQSLGWTKAKELVGIVNDDNLEEWKEKLDGKSYRELMELLRASNSDEGDGDSGGSGDGGGDNDNAPREKAHRKAFSLFDDQLANVNNALAKAKEIANSDKDGHALDMICLDFLSANAGVDSQAEFLEKVEKTLGIKLIAYDANEDSIVFGGDTLDQIVEVKAGVNDDSGVDSDDDEEEAAEEEAA